MKGDIYDEESLTAQAIGLLTARAEKAEQRVTALEAELVDYEEVLNDKRRLARIIGEILYGEDAAKQPSLYDLVGPIEDLKAEATRYREALENLVSLCAPIEDTQGHEHCIMWNDAIEGAQAALRPRAKESND